MGNAPPPPPAPVGAAAAAAPPPPAEEEPSGGRNDLLASIRQASKAKLKPAKDRKMSRKKEKEAATVAPSSGGNLMGDLAARLAVRLWAW